MIECVIDFIHGHMRKFIKEKGMNFYFWVGVEDLNKLVGS